MQGQRLFLKRLVVAASLLTLLFGPLTGCANTSDRKLTVIDPTTQKQSANLALERIDRLDDVVALDWLTEEELLYRSPSSAYGEMQIFELQTGKARATTMRAEQTAIVSPDRRHVLLLSDMTASIADLTTGRVLPLCIGDDRVTWLLRDSIGSWTAEQTFILPIVKDNKYGLGFAQKNSTVTPVFLPTSDSPIQKVSMYGERLYYLTRNKQLKSSNIQGTDEKLIRTEVSDFALSQDGSRLALSLETSADEVSLFITDSQGLEPGTFVVKGRLLQQLAWSPDGHKLAFAIFNLAHGMTGLYVMDAQTGGMLPLSPTHALNSPVVWSPSSQQLFVSHGQGSLPFADGKGFTTIYRFKH